MKPNYYESEYYRILLFNNKFNDKFKFNIENNKIIVQRIDTRIGWGQNLEIIVKDKIMGKNFIYTIGNSEENIKEFIFDKKEEYIIHHHENDLFKIFYISELYNDNFIVKYNETDKNIYIERIDINDGWGQNLKLKYIEKNLPFKEKLINIGSSKKNKIFSNINLDEIKYLEKDNYYESENYKINLAEIKYQDRFLIKFYEETMTVYIKRIDSKEGWGQNLQIEITDIKKNIKNIINIGKSIKNEIYTKIDLEPKKYFIGLTTIPSRIKLDIFKTNLEKLLKFDLIENIFITIAYKYKRFEEKIPDDIILYLSNKPKIILIILDEDFGPASKYLGPLIYYHELLLNNILIIVDDDREYNKNLIDHFKIAYNSYPNIIFSSGKWKEYFNKNYKNIDDNRLEIELFKEENNNKIHFGDGVGGFYGFGIKVIDKMEKFINYNFKIMERLPKSIYHDEGIILGYLKYKGETIMYLKHKGCELIKKEMVDALCNSNLVNRENIEREIYNITNLENLL
jgi:hypothetical protein